jgi:hypothetical protein
MLSLSNWGSRGRGAFGVKVPQIEWSDRNRWDCSEYCDSENNDDDDDDDGDDVNGNDNGGGNEVTDLGGRTRSGTDEKAEENDGSINGEEEIVMVANSEGCWRGGRRERSEWAAASIEAQE